jgi:hypothetical protein
LPAPLGLGRPELLLQLHTQWNTDSKAEQDIRTTSLVHAIAGRTDPN